MAASICASDPAAPPVVALADYGWTPPGAAVPALAGVTLRLEAGECALLGGPTGAGKSTLLRAIAGALPPGGVSHGRREVAGRPALLFQEVETQLLFSTVEEEVASGLRGAPDDARRDARVAAALARAGLADLGARSVEDLSAGERQRVVLAALLAGEPSLLLLDEPSSALDPAAREQLVEALARLKTAGHTLLVAEHVTAPFRGLADRHLELRDGRLVDAPPRGARPAAVGAARRERAAGALPPPGPRAAHPRAPALVRCAGVAVRDAGGRTRLTPTDLVLRGGERLLVEGTNGAGKSTLLRVLAGLVAPSEGAVAFGAALAGPGAAAAHPAPGRVALVLQSPARNLFAHTVGEEVAFTLVRSGAAPAEVGARVGEVLEAFGLAELRERSPLRLSFGEQHAVAIAAALASRPALLLLDEPFAGLDARARRRLLARLEREQARTGLAVVVATHDPGGLESWARRRVRLRAPARAERTGPTREPHRRPASPGRAGHYRETGSALHRLGVGWKLLGLGLGVAAAVAARTPLAVAGLLAAWVAGYRAARLSWADLRQDARWLAVQALVITALAALRGGAEGAAAGVLAAAQIAAFFLPGALLLRTTPVGRLLAGVRRALPPRLAFAMASSLRFAPFFAREIEEIVSVQRLRGARLRPRDAWRPGAWRDAVACAGVPLAVRAIHTANEAAWAAEIRGVASPPAPPAPAAGRTP